MQGLSQLGSITPFTGSEARDRIGVMFLQVAKGLRDPLTRTLAAQALAGIPSRDDWAEVQAIFWAVKNHVRYTGDTRGLDTYQTLRRTWELGIGDCDDMTIAVMTLAISVGFNSGAKIISEDGTVYTHVYSVVELPREDVDRSNRRIVPLDATVPTAVPGWEAPPERRRLERIFWYEEQGQG
jgi:hypothetical protein